MQDPSTTLRVLEVVKSAFKEVKETNVEEWVHCKLWHTAAFFPGDHRKEITQWMKINFPAGGPSVEEFGRRAFDDPKFPKKLKIDSLLECAGKIELALEKVHVWNFQASNQSYTATLFKTQRNKLECLVQRGGLPSSDDYAYSIQVPREHSIDAAIHLIKHCDVILSLKQRQQSKLSGKLHFGVIDRDKPISDIPVSLRNAANQLQTLLSDSDCAGPLIDQDEILNKLSIKVEKTPYEKYLKRQLFRKTLDLSVLVEALKECAMTLEAEIARIKKEVHTWEGYSLEEKYTISLLEVDGRLECLVHKQSDRSNLSDFAFCNPQVHNRKSLKQYLCGGSPERLEADLPQRDSRDSVLRGRVTFYCIKNNIHSKFDPMKKLDPYNWAITLIDSGASQADPLTWGGHAKILIEGVGKGEYFQHSSDLVYDKTNAKACVRYYDSENYRVSFRDQPHRKYSKYTIDLLSKSETYIRSIEAVHRMLNKIRADKFSEVREIHYSPVAEFPTETPSLPLIATVLIPGHVFAVALLATGVVAPPALPVVAIAGGGVLIVSQAALVVGVLLGPKLGRFVINQRFPNKNLNDLSRNICIQNCITWELGILREVGIELYNGHSSIFFPMPSQYTGK